MNALPILNLSRCIGCGECVAVCPTECLAMLTAVPWLPRPLDCVACTLCEMICPTAAITIAEPGREPASNSA